MPNGTLSAREYDLFKAWWRRSGKGWRVPPNREDIRETEQYKAWVKEEPFARLAPGVREILEPFGIPIPPEAVFGVPTPAERIRAAGEAKAEAEGISLGEEVEVPEFPSEPPPPGFRWAFDRDLNRWVPQFAGLTAAQEAEQRLAQQQMAGFPAPTTTTMWGRGGAGPITGAAKAPTDPFGRTATWNARLGQWDYPPNWGQRPADEPEPTSAWERAQLDIQEQQLRQQRAQQEAQQTQFQQQLAFQQERAQIAAEEQERQYMSQLAAQPINWLQYAAYTGQEPVVQPWMVPLGFQNQGGDIVPQGLQIGQPIPGFQGQVGQMGQQTFANLPQLTTPSTQLQARWGPTAQAQFLGYQQARTGAAPEETQFRLGSQRAPTGAFTGFSRFR